MATVADVLRKIERVKKDLEYVRTFQEKWRDQRDRFPKIYDGIIEQERAFLRRIEELKGLRVDAPAAILQDPASAMATPPPGRMDETPSGEGSSAAAFASPSGLAGEIAEPGAPGASGKPRIEASGTVGAGEPNGSLLTHDSGDERRAAATAAGEAIGEKLRKRTGTSPLMPSFASTVVESMSTASPATKAEEPASAPAIAS